MNAEYQELVNQVSHQVAQAFVTHETNLARRATMLDADIQEICQQIGLAATKQVLTQILDDHVTVHQQAGLTCQERPLIVYNVVFGRLDLPSPYLWKQGTSAKPLRDAMGITHHGRSEAVTRALSDFGSEESFGVASKRFAEHYHFPLSSSTATRVTKQVAQEAQDYLAKKLSAAGQESSLNEENVSSCTHMLVELDACKIRTATLEARESSEERTPAYHNPKKRKVLQWRDVRMGLSRPLETRSKLYVGKMGSYGRRRSALSGVSSGRTDA